MRKIESLPEAQVYQVLDYIEFLESKYTQEDLGSEASGLQRLAEGLEDKLRKRAFNPSNFREAFQLIAAADRAISGVARAGREILGEFSEGGKGGEAKGGEARGREERARERDRERSEGHGSSGQSSGGGGP